MQLLLQGGTTPTTNITTTAVAYPITRPVLAQGVTDASALIEVPPGLSAQLQAQLVYRLFTTDDSQSAGNWLTIGAVIVGTGKALRAGPVTVTGGLQIQLGIQVSMQAGAAYGRARLRFPVLVTS